jgi:hypothetical protein
MKWDAQIYIHTCKIFIKGKVMNCLLIFYASGQKECVFLPFFLYPVTSAQGLVTLYSEDVPMF